MNADVVIYDVTTFRFESVKKDTLRDFGFSKENRVNEVRVVLGLFIDTIGRPIGYELSLGIPLKSKHSRHPLINSVKDLVYEG